MDTSRHCVIPKVPLLICSFILAAALLTSCKNSSVYTQWYAFPPEESIFEGDWTLLAGVSKQQAPMFSLELSSGLLVVVSITSKNGTELARREIVFPGISEVSFVGRWESKQSFSVDIFDETSATVVGESIIATLRIKLKKVL